MKNVCFLAVLLLITFCLKAQEQLLNVAKQYLSAGEFEKAAATYKQLADYNQNDEDILLGYFESLKGMKDFKAAEKVIRQQIKLNPNNKKYPFELARMVKLQGDDKKAGKMFESLISELNPFEEEVRNTALLFQREGMYDYAISVYQKGKSFNKENTYLYAEELALLYDKKGDSDKAIESLLDVYVSRSEKAEDVKAAFQTLLNNVEKREGFKKKILKRISSEPDVMAFPDLLAWLYIQQGDYESAFVQVKSIDNRLGEEGRRALGFARMALRERKFSAAIQAYNYVIEKGKEKSYYLIAASEKLTCMKEELRFKPRYTPQEVEAIATAYQQFIDENPAYKQKETLREYAELEARYTHNIDKAIALLSEITNSKIAEPGFRGRCKLEMGDYELVRNNIWESTLLYSQVDKEFRQDMLGEEARYKNAKLSYYTGDFAWAQGQLDVLKASTSELIANDALNLSVLITENNPPADSNTTPLLMFARADLLEFQNKDEAALNTLDSIATLFPEHPLQDNILMERANIATKHQDYNEAAMHLQKIVNLYADDVLADDALYTLAGINETYFNNKEEAKRLYEQLILKYPGSTFINEARKKFRILRGDKADVETPKMF